MTHSNSFIGVLDTVIACLFPSFRAPRGGDGPQEFQTFLNNVKGFFSI